MTEDTITKILNIRVKYDDAIKTLAHYRTSLDQIASAEKQLKQELKDGLISQDHYSQQISALTQNKKYLQTVTKEVTRSVQNNIKVEKEEEGSLTQLRAKLSKLTAEYDKLSRAEREGLKGAKLKSDINEITKALKDAEMATQRFYRNVGNYQSALVGLRELGGAFKVFGGIVTGVLGGLGLEKFTNNMIDVAKNFEDAMARIRAVANPNSGEFSQLRDKALELGKETRYTATEVANAMEELARKGYSAHDSMELVGHVLKLAQANVTSMTDAAQVATSTMRAFSLGADEAERTVDVLSSACSHSATNLVQLGEAMKTAGPAAAAANVSLEDTVALIGSLANVGMTGSDAGTGVKQVLIGLTTAMNGTEKARKILEHYNLDITEARIRSGELMDILVEMKKSGIGNSLADLKNLVGKYAAPRMANIVRNVDETAGLDDILKNSFGENERMYEESIGKTSDALYKLKSAWENMLITMYDSTSEYLVTPLVWLKDAINALSGQITFLGQTFVSVLAGIAASAGWKGLMSIGGFLSATWADVKAKAVGNLTELEQAYATAQETLISLKEKETSITAQLDEASARKTAILEEQRTLKHNIEEAKRTMTTKVENAKRAMEEAKATAKASGASKAEIAEIVRLHKAGIAEITAQEKAGIREMEVLQKQYTKAYAQNEATITRLTYEQSIARREIATAENNVRTTEAAKVAAVATAPNMASWSGFWALTKSSLKAVGGMLKSFLPFLVIFGVVEFLQGLKRVQDRLSEIEAAEDRVREKVNTAIAEDKKIARLQAIKKLVSDLNAEQNTNNKLTEQSHKNLVAIANRLNLSKEAQEDINKNLKIQKSTYDEITRAVDKLIAKQKEQAKKNALNGIVEETTSQSVKLALDYGINLTEPDDIDKEFFKRFQNKGSFDKLMQIVGDTVGINDFYTAAQKVTALKKQRDFALKELAKMGGGAEELAKTDDGGYNPADLSNGKKGRKGKDYRAQLLNLINQWTDKLKATEIATNNDAYQKALEKAKEEMDKLNRDIETFVGNDKQKGTLFEAFKKEPVLGKQLKDLFKQVSAASEVKYSNDVDVINFDKYKKDISVKIQHAKEKQTNLPKYVEEYFDIETNVVSDTFQHDLKEMILQYKQGKFGGTKKKGSFAEIEEGYEEYETKRKSIIDDYISGRFGNDTLLADKRKKERLEALDAEYKAEAERYYRLGVLDEEYGRKLRANELARIDAQNAIREQGIQNELDQIRLKYETELNMAYDHYKKLGFASDEYWGKLKGRIGKDEAVELKLEWELATAELEDLKMRGWDRQAETYEVYTARVIAAQQKVESIHTRANQAIEKSDMTRFQAAQTVTEGLIKLSEEAGKQDKDMANLAKILALFNIAINTGEAIAKMTSQESGKGIVGIATTAAGIAAILANMASAISIVKSAKFAKGKVNISGAGSETSDSIPAYISRGESVINAKATKMFEPLLIAINAIGNGVALPRNNYVQTQQTADITEAFSTAVAEIRPVVDVREVTRVQNRVETLQKLDSI